MQLGLLSATACAIFSQVAAQAPFEARPEGTIPFRLNHFPTAEKHQIETMPGGVAVLDYDNDGRLDLFFANGAPQPGLKKTGPEHWNRLYRNLGEWKFEDVTERAGLSGEGYGMGVAAGDYDNDGWTDLAVTAVGFTQLYRNRGDGTFEDATKRAGVPATGWPISAGWFDMDQDGDLDLFVVNYCRWDPATEPFCGDRRAGYRTYCHPKYYEGLANTLLRNNGDGTFTDVSAASGIGAKVGKGMAVAFADYDGDGRADVLVTNDTTPNFLFRNEGGGRFTEAGFGAGVAIADDGKVLSTMGADFRDVDNDGRPDVFLTALSNETFPLFRNLGKGLFEDRTFRSKLGALSMAHSGWSAGMYDFDNDGWKDLFTANGDVQDNTELFSSRASKQQNQLFRNRGDGTFESALFGEAAQHRGTAFGDLDGDGRVDVVVTRLGGSPVLYRNTMGGGAHWLGLRLRGMKANRDGLGAVVKVVSGGRAQWNHATTSVGYLSSSERTVRFGLGASAVAEVVEITWPGGKVQRLEGVKADRVVEVIEP